MRMVAGMIVSQSQHSGIAEQGFFQYDAHVDSCFAQTAMADTKGLYESEMLIEQQHPCLFDIEILHAWMQVFVDGRRRIQGLSFLGFLHSASFAQLARG